MHSGLTLANSSDEPAYRQIVNQVKERVATGDWESGVEIPSIRELAAELRVSTITVRRAYLELGQEGVIVSRQGRPSVVSEQAHSLSTRMFEQELWIHLGEIVRLADVTGWTDQELLDALLEARREHARRTA